MTYWNCDGDPDTRKGGAMGQMAVSLARVIVRIGKCLAVILSLTLAYGFFEMAWAQDTDGTCSFNTPANENFSRWVDSYEMAPRAYIDPSIDLKNGSGGSFSLLSYLKYDPAERDQGSCKNGWAWAGTGVMEIALDVREGVSDRLSIQYISSCNTAKSCCDFGTLEDLANFYSFQGITIPWSNTNADWKNGNGSCNVPCGSIDTWPNYGIDSIVAESIKTHGIGQSQAISNIKNVLHQNKAVFFLWFFPTQADRVRFLDFWNTQEEDATFTLNYCCGKT